MIGDTPKCDMRTQTLQKSKISITHHVMKTFIYFVIIINSTDHSKHAENRFSCLVYERWLTEWFNFIRLIYCNEEITLCLRHFYFLFLCFASTKLEYVNIQQFKLKSLDDIAVCAVCSTHFFRKVILFHDELMINEWSQRVYKHKFEIRNMKFNSGPHTHTQGIFHCWCKKIALFTKEKWK